MERFSLGKAVMIFPVMMLGLFGLVVSAKSRPKTALTKSRAFGARSGRDWLVEHFPDAAVLVVHDGQGKAQASFQVEVQEGRRKFIYKSGKGSAELLALMREDFEGVTA